MFKRSSKLAAVLVAAAAMTSMVPATAAEKLESKEGNITNARAFNGGYIYDGYRSDDDSAALYYNNGDKDSNIDEDEDYDEYSLEKYGEKYITVKDGDDDYLIDITTGKIDDDESISDKVDNARNKLKSKISKENRYKSDSKKGEVKDFERVLDNNKYGDVWYKFTATGDSNLEDRVTTAAGAYMGFTDDSGKYIDVSQTANMHVYDKELQKTVKVEEYGKTYGKNNICVKLEDIKAVAQDKENIYAVATVVVNETDRQYFLQKISKAQGTDKDGGKLPKSVASYQIDNKSIYDDGDMETAYYLLVEGNNGSESDKHEVVNYTAKDGFIYVTAVNEGNNENANVELYKLKLAKDKIDGVDGKEKIDSYVIYDDDDNDNDTVARNSSKGDVYSIDAEGVTWILDKGKIYKADGVDFKEVYTCDRTLNKLDVYDEKNLIAWDSEGDVYTTVSEGKAQTTTGTGESTTTTEEPTNTTTTTTTSAQVGWVKNADSTWSYYKDGAKATGWVQDGAWYYLDTAGIMQTGWVKDNGTWYYCNNSGAMQTGWVNDNGTWYYCNNSGAMLANQWFQDTDGKWYYLQASGAMAVNTTIGGYVIGADGAWVR